MGLASAATKRRHYEANRVRYAEQRRAAYALNKEVYAARIRKWQQSNRGRRNLAARKRQDHVAAIYELFPGEWEAIVEKCDNRCIVLGCGASPVTQDHVVPLSKGGRHHISNLQPLCLCCNASKGTKVIDYRKVV